MAKGAALMIAFAVPMRNYEVKHHDKIEVDISAHTYRHLGRLADSLHLYSYSETMYQTAANYIFQSSDIGKQANILEYQGFIAYSQAKQGKPEAFNSTIQVLGDYENSDYGRQLKKDDPVKCAIWKSGVEIRMAEHFSTSADPNIINTAKSWLQNAEDILQVKDGVKPEFRLRADALARVQEMYKSK